MSNCIFVMAQDGTLLMPTFNWKKVRRQLKTGRAKIAGHEPFTIQLRYKSTKNIQPIETCEDTGDVHMGFSLKSEKHEYVSNERDHLSGEKIRHDDRRKYRRSRRNRKRHREPRFDNRDKNTSGDDKWLAPSIKNKELNHLRLIGRYKRVCPITDIWLECGSFDTQALQAVEEKRPIPVGEEYQHGSRYGHDTLREAVFYRDNYTCICCNKGIDAGKILRMHHLGFKNGDHTNRMSNLATVCTTCHTPAAHKPGGKLYELEPKLKPFKSASFMTSMRYQLYRDVKATFPDTAVHMCYGASTKRERLSRRIKKTHANDAYCIGKFRPKHRSQTEYYQKRRRNNRILEKFYDAAIIDVRDGSKRKGAELGCNRTNRNVPRNNSQNLRTYRGQTITKGRRTIRRKRYAIQNGDIAVYQGKQYAVSGTMHYGEYVKLKGGPECIKANKIHMIKHQGAWEKLSKEVKQGAFTHP